MKMKEIELDNKCITEDDSYFKENDDGIYCEPCVSHSMSPHTPLNLRKFSKGGYGHFLKPDTDNAQTNYKRKKNRADHVKNPLHIWCVQRAKEEKEDEELETIKNRVASEIIIKNVLCSLSSSGGAEEYMRECNKDQTNLADKYPTKNDGKQMYFELRDLIVDKTNKDIQESFKKVKSASFTLDKVTVSHIPYTFPLHLLL